MNKKDKKMYESVIDKYDGRCALCRCTTIQLHHVFGGSNRPASTKYGMVVPLCPYHHELIHRDAELMKKMRQKFQKEFEQTHTREEFMKIFHKNYL